MNKRSLQPYRLFSIGWILILLQDLTMAAIGLFFTTANNLWVYNISFPLQQLFCMFFFLQLLGQSKWMIGIFLFALFAAFNLAFQQGPGELNTMSIMVGGILIVIMACSELYSIYKRETAQSLFHDPAFWISAGFVLFWAFASPYFAMYNSLWKTHPTFFNAYFYTVNFGLLVLLNLSIIKALQCSLRATRSSFS